MPCRTCGQTFRYHPFNGIPFLSLSLPPPPPCVQPVAAASNSSPSRAHEKVSDLETLFVNFHSLLNRYRAHQVTYLLSPRPSP